MYYFMSICGGEDLVSICCESFGRGIRGVVRAILTSYQILHEATTPTRRLICTPYVAREIVINRITIYSSTTTNGRILFTAGHFQLFQLYSRVLAVAIAFSKSYHPHLVIHCRCNVTRSGTSNTALEIPRSTREVPRSCGSSRSYTAMVLGQLPVGGSYIPLTICHGTCRMSHTPLSQLGLVYLVCALISCAP